MREPTFQPNVDVDPLVTALRVDLGLPRDGLTHGGWQCGTSLDRLFSQIATLVRTYANPRTIEALALELLVEAMIDTNPSKYRRSTDVVDHDIEWFDGTLWRSVRLVHASQGRSIEQAVGSLDDRAHILILWDGTHMEDATSVERGLLVLPPSGTLSPREPASFLSSWHWVRNRDGPIEFIDDPTLSIVWDVRARVS